MRSTLLHPEVTTEKNFLSPQGTDFIEFYAGNARQAAFYYRSAFGMCIVAYSGPETGQLDRVSYVLQQGAVRFVITGTLRADDEIAHHVHRHGDSVANIAFTVEDARQSWKETIRRGARSVHEPHELRDEFGSVKTASIAAFGETIHTFVERSNYDGPFLPGYQALEVDSEDQVAPLTAVDHISADVGWNEKNRWVDFYATSMGFSPYLQNTVFRPASTTPRIMADGAGNVKISISEPVEGPSRSHVEEYLEYNHGAGVQHIALATGDILTTVKEMRGRGVEFLRVSDAYYETLNRQPAGIEESIEELRQNHILAEADEEGYVLQAFTRPIEDRPTLIFEIIQRKGSRGFGREDSDALFQAITNEK
ncbi:4-hydroxyphenylpyruvate dioxygenase [Silvibacterium acidisoli]|uniref:4-hydroxyphenylpyruvate dioxygenase n=1 Tax=Acidobacteriaceae bacterium ZG23-2 TaxID=2883246 RepID=UPI00406D02CD